MTPKNRRFGYRVPVDFFIDQYTGQRRNRVLATNISESGVLVHRASLEPGAETVALEISLPGQEETIWARGEVRYDKEATFSQETGIKFTGIARAHARALRDYCVESRRSHLGNLLAAIAA